MTGFWETRGVIVRFVLALLVWTFVGLLVAADADAQVPPDSTDARPS